jgi:proteasome lid subunit RPN8/RPN11
MADPTFTASQAPEDPAALSSAIQEAIQELQEAFSEQEVVALHWNAHYVVIPLEVEVDLPSRGPVGDVDIRAREPIFLRLHRKHYPYQAPSTFSNRRDFPAEYLPHLNSTLPGTASNFCLHRGSLNNWFAEHTIVDLVKRVQTWLRDAVGDRLMRPEDGFEETRIPTVLGYGIFEPASIREKAYRHWRLHQGSGGFCFLWYQLLNNSSQEPLIGTNTYAIRLFTSLQGDMLDKPLELSQKINMFHKELGSAKVDVERMLFGVLAWPAQDRICSRFFGHLPDTLRAFLTWAEALGIPLTEALTTYLASDLQLFGGVPVTLIVPRPQHMIRTDSTLEILNFNVIAGGEHWPKEGQWDLDATVYSMGHRAPLTLHRAREISSQPSGENLGPLLFLGCGAIGSKLILHLARSGQANMSIIDYDDLSPHNLVRHALVSDSLGVNKAEGIKKVIEGMYYADTSSLHLEAIKISATEMLLGDQDLLSRHTWLIDSSASPMLLNLLSHLHLPDTLACCRGEIADAGRLGFLSVEGYSRNPRLDDLQVLLFDLAIDNPMLSRWLRRNQQEREELVGSVLEDIYIGLSCSSETMRLSDEIVSLHSSAFATGFRKVANQDPQKRLGKLQISYFSEASDLLFSVQSLTVNPITHLSARNNPRWEIRFRHGLDQDMKRFLHRTAPNETGGLLIGLINQKRRIIYVTRILPAPADSKSSPYAFVRGIKDIPSQVLTIQEKTGGILGYVGEWHTHPMGGPNLSDVDMETVEKIKRHLDSIPLPTHITVVTRRGIYPHVFTPT